MQDTWYFTELYASVDVCTRSACRLVRPEAACILCSLAPRIMCALSQVGRQAEWADSQACHAFACLHLEGTAGSVCPHCALELPFRLTGHETGSSPGSWKHCSSQGKDLCLLSY